MVSEEQQICGSNLTFKAHTRYDSITGFNLNHKLIKYCVPQGSFLKPLLFRIFINDLNFAITNSTTFYFADDTCLLNVKQSIKEIKKSVNKSLKSLLHWLIANKISLNVTKNEVVIFRAEGEVFDTDLKLKMSGKILYPSHHVKYLGAKLDKYFNWGTHVNQLCVKLVKANVMLSKIHYFVNQTTLRYIYFALFNSNLSYAYTAWGQFIVPSHKICILQRNALQIICFDKFSDHTTQLFCKMKTKFFDLVSVETVSSQANAFLANLTLYLAICIIQALVDIITKQDLL